MISKNNLYIIIPALNEENLIHKTLESLDKQNSSEFSVIVVDNGSTDSTKEVVNKYSQHSNYKLILIEENKKGVGHARASGSLEAIKNGALYLAGTDADTILPSNWIECIYNGFAEGYKVLVGECDPFTKVKINNKNLEFILNARSLLFKNVKPYFRGANYAIAAGLYKSVGGFKQPYTEDNIPAPGEDVLLEIAILSQGESVYGVLPPVYPHPRRYINNLQNNSNNGSIHEGNVVTQIRNEAELEKYLTTVSGDALNKFVHKVSIGLFNQFVLEVFRNPVLKDKYWENTLQLLKPYEKSEIDKDLLSYKNTDSIWIKYGNVFYNNLRKLKSNHS